MIESIPRRRAKTTSPSVLSSRRALPPALYRKNEKQTVRSATLEKGQWGAKILIETQKLHAMPPSKKLHPQPQCRSGSTARIQYVSSIIAQHQCCRPRGGQKTEAPISIIIASASTAAISAPRGCRKTEAQPIPTSPASSPILPRHRLQENVENEYPKTFKLVTILVAVMLAVFLVALDMVSLKFPSLFLSSHTNSASIDHCSNCHSQYNGRISQPRSGWMVR